MLQLVEEMTTIYFRLPDSVGITYDQLNKLINLKNRPYSQVATGQIKNIQDEIELINNSLKGIDMQSTEYKEALDIISEKFADIDTIKKQLRPFGHGVVFDIETHLESKLAWFKYCREETLSDDEIIFIKEFIQEALNSDEVIIEVEYYKLDEKLN